MSAATGDPTVPTTPRGVALYAGVVESRPPLRLLVDVDRGQTQQLDEVEDEQVRYLCPTVLGPTDHEVRGVGGPTLRFLGNAESDNRHTGVAPRVTAAPMAVRFGDVIGEAK